MLYQKARILENAPVPVQGRGKYLWVQAQPPKKETTVGIYSGVVDQQPIYVSHIRGGPDVLVVGLSPQDVELLPEFREDVPFIELDDWLTEESCHT